MLDLLPPLVRSVRARHPDVELDIRELTGAVQVEELRHGRLDLGLLHVRGDDPPEGLCVSQLRAEPFAVALPADHRLAHRKMVRLKELRDDPLVVVRPEPEADTNALYLEACAEAGFAARVAQHVTSLQALLGFVAAGIGWALVARSLVTSLERAGLSFVSLQGTSVRLPTALAWPQGKLAAAPRLVRDTAEESLRIGQ